MFKFAEFQPQFRSGWCPRVPPGHKEKIGQIGTQRRRFLDRTLSTETSLLGSASEAALCSALPACIDIRTCKTIEPPGSVRLPAGGAQNFPKRAARVLIQAVQVTLA